MTDTDLETMLRRFTPQQRRKLARLDSAPWSWFCSDDKFTALLAEYDRDAMRRYWATLTRVTSYQGEDYRIRAHGQSTWIRASRLQYDQADHLGMQRSIGVPEYVAA